MSERRKSRVAFIVVGLFVALAVLSAPSAAEGWETQLNVTITDDGTAATTEFSLTMNESDYRELRSVSTDQGFDSVAAFLADRRVSQRQQYSSYDNAVDRRVSEGYTISFVHRNADLPASDTTAITADDDTLRMTVSDIQDPAESTQFDAVTYRVTVPGQITETNAIETDSNTAIWRLHEEYQRTLSLTADTGTTNEDSTETTTEQGSTEPTSEGWETELDVTINADGRIERAETALLVDDTSYQQLSSVASEQGFDSVAAYIADQQVSGRPQYGGYTNAVDQESSDGYRLSFEYTNIDIQQSNRSDLTIDGNRLQLSIGGVDDPERSDQVSAVTYRVTVPGKITATNAIETNGNTAIWRLHEDHHSVLTVTANISADSSDEEEENEEEETATGFGPGFGVMTALLGAVLSIAALARRQQ